MKKLLGLLLVMTMAWPVTASADVLKNVDLKGEIQTIASDVRHNTRAAGAYNSGTNTRVLAGLSADLVEDVRANILFQYVTVWNGNTQGDTVHDYWNNVRLAEANVVLSNLFCCLEATVGRQFYGDENSAVMYFGPKHYNAEPGFLAAESLDAVKLFYSDDLKSFTVIAGKTSGLGEQGGHDGASFYGMDFKLNLTDAFSAQVYGYNFRNVDAFNGQAYEEKDSGFYGAKVAFAPEAFSVSAEYARNFAGDRLVKEGHNTGYMVKADAALNVLEKVTPRATFLYAKEGFTAFGNYMPGLLVGQKLVGQKLGGDIFAYSDEGVRLFNVGFDFKPYEKWTVSLDGYAFQGRNGHHAATFEGDLTASYAHNDYVELFAGIGYAKYGNDGTYKADYGRDNTKGQIGMLINF